MLRRSKRLEREMLSSAATLGATQVSRAASLPVSHAGHPARTAFLENFRQRNALLDALFYDVGIIAPAEAVEISPWLAAEGAIIIVPPSGSGPLVLCKSADDLAARGESVVALAVAGVGSSALGSAAFARNVADAIGGSVAAVVSGYGLADLLTEAVGGFFWFGALNGLRHGFEGLDEAARPSAATTAAIASGDDLLVRTSRDTATVLALLRDKRLSLRYLIGHSKGNLVISEALYALVRHDATRAAALAESTRIVTVSARIAMPPRFREVLDIMGGFDWFGGLNSRPDIKPDHTVPSAWHHTNTELPAHLPVTVTLRALL